MGKRRKDGAAPATNTWASKSPQEKADAFDASYEAHQARAEAREERLPLPDEGRNYGGSVGIPASGPSTPDDE